MGADEPSRIDARRAPGRGSRPEPPARRVRCPCSPRGSSPESHITLAHPRNPKAHGNSLEPATSLPEGLQVTFTGVRLIEQIDAQPWRVLREFALTAW